MREEPGDFRMAAALRHLACGFQVVDACACEDVCATCEEQFDDLPISRRCCPVERRAVVEPASLDVGAAFEQQRDQLVAIRSPVVPGHGVAEIAAINAGNPSSAV